jgi:hypothetical protein
MQLGFTLHTSVECDLLHGQRKYELGIVYEYLADYDRLAI